jgi:hypothetical protein
VAEIIIPVGYGNAVLTWHVPERANPVSSTFGFGFNPGSTALEVADSLYDAATGSTGPCNATKMYSDQQFLGVKVTMNIGGTLFINEHVQTVTGSVTRPADTETLNSTSLIIKKLTGVGGRANRGRAYTPLLAIPSTALSSDGTIANTPRGQATEWWESFRTAAAGDEILLCVLHSHADDEPTAIANLQCGVKVGTQRRRLRN